MFALASLVHGARAGEPGLFVAFEEDARRVIANAASFDWGLADLVKRNRLYVLDARLPQAVIQGGAFDLQGLLAGVGALVRRMRAERLVLDGIDLLLGALGSPDLERRELFALHEWLSKSGLTTLLTAKTEGVEKTAHAPYLSYLSDCVVVFRTAVEHGIAQRRLRVAKLRGSAHSANEFPLLVSTSGIEVATYGPATRDYRASTRKVSSGIARLDHMLGGGFFRGSSILVTGAPGTAKSTLGAAFAVAACERGEKTLLVSLDEPGDQIVRNMASVNLRLRPHMESGLLHLLPIHPRGDSAEEHLAQIRSALVAHGARNLIVDPISAFGGALGVSPVDPAKRLLDLARRRGITVVATSLLEGPDAGVESSAAGISTVADTWIHLSYLVHGGERNRALTIVKSRGMGHSNQVRELILSARGIDLADVYTSGGDVLMGTLRWQKEQQERREQEERSAAAAQRRRELELELAENRARIAVLQRELQAREAALRSLAAEHSAEMRAVETRRRQIARLRQAEHDTSPSDARSMRRRKGSAR